MKELRETVSDSVNDAVCLSLAGEVEGALSEGVYYEVWEVVNGAVGQAVEEGVKESL